MNKEDPVAWRSTSPDGKLSNKFACKPTEGNWVEPLYATPPKQWVGLTDEQVEDEWERITGHSIFGGDRSEGRAMYISPDEVIEFSRAIEQALREKNT